MLEPAKNPSFLRYFGFHAVDSIFHSVDAQNCLNRFLDVLRAYVAGFFLVEISVFHGLVLRFSLDLGE